MVGTRSYYIAELCKLFLWSNEEMHWKHCKHFLETRFNFSQFVGSEVVHLCLNTKHTKLLEKYSILGCFGSHEALLHDFILLSIWISYTAVFPCILGKKHMSCFHCKNLEENGSCLLFFFHLRAGFVWESKTVVIGPPGGAIKLFFLNTFSVFDKKFHFSKENQEVNI